MSLRRVRLAGFSDDTRGTIAIMFALLAMPLLMGIFVAIDYNRATSLKVSLQSAADAAAYTAASRLGGPKSEVRKTFKAAFRANLPLELADQKYTLSIANDEKSLDISIDAGVDTTLAKAAGIPRIDFVVTARADRPKIRIPRSIRVGGTNKNTAHGKVAGDIQRNLEQMRKGDHLAASVLSDAELKALMEAVMQQLGR